MKLLLQNSISILSIISLGFTFSYIIKNDFQKWINILSIGLILIGTIFSLTNMSVFILIPMQLFGLFGTFLIKSKNNEKLTKYYSIIQYVLVMLLLLIAMNFSSASSNTWGSGTLYLGVFMILFLIPLKHLTIGLYKNDLIYGILNLITGLIAIILIIKFGFEESEFNSEMNFMSRKGVIVLGLTLILEGILVFYNSKKKN